MDDLVSQNFLTDEIFETQYFKKCLETLYSLSSYKELQTLLTLHNLSTKIYYLKITRKKETLYSAELEILDASGQLYQIPNPYERKDELMHLVAEANILTCYHKNGKLVLYDWQEQWTEDILPILEYLKSIS